MANLMISEELAQRLNELSQREQRPVEQILESLLAKYEPPTPVDIDENDPEYQAALKEIRPKLYRIARRYWQKVGDQERLALTDEQLDEQFWLIDHEGIPRLKSEQGTIQLPPDPLEGLVGLLDNSVKDEDLNTATDVRETLAKYTHPDYGWTKRDRTD